MLKTIKTVLFNMFFTRKKKSKNSQVKWTKQKAEKSNIIYQINSIVSFMSQTNTVSSKMTHL